MTAWGGRRVQRLLSLVLSTYGTTCHLCLAPIVAPRGHEDGPSVDHVVPRSAGGTDDLDNLRPAHKRCNSRRRNRPLTPALLHELRRVRRAPESAGAFFRR